MGYISEVETIYTVIELSLVYIAHLTINLQCRYK